MLISEPGSSKNGINWFEEWEEILINYILKKKNGRKDICGGGIRDEGLDLRWWCIDQGHDRADLRCGLGL